MLNNKDERLLELNKNDTVDLMCLYDEYSLGGINLKDCRFTDQYMDRSFSQTLEHMKGYIPETYVPETKIELALISLFLGNQSGFYEICKEKKYCSLILAEKHTKYKELITFSNLNKYMEEFKNKYGDNWFENLPGKPTISK